MMVYERVVRPILFRSDAEWIHDRAVVFSEWASGGSIARWLGSRLELREPILNLRVAGLEFAHPLGLAAGFDKSGRGIPLWESFGFSHVEIGSISAHPSAGNPKPRLFRVPKDNAIVVNYGLPNDGASAVGARLARVRRRTPLGVNIVNTNRGPGAPAESNDAIIADYVESVARLQSEASYLVLNLSCPNTCDGRSFVSDSGRVRQLLSEVASAVQPGKPVFLKVAPFADEGALDAFLLAAGNHPFVSGYSINLPPGKPPTMTATSGELRNMPGAVSGRPAEAAANRAIAQLYARIDRKRQAIIGSGGVFTAEDAWLKIRLGASLVQCLTAMVYQGPSVVRRIAEGLAAIARREGLSNIEDAIGTHTPR